MRFLPLLSLVAIATLASSCSSPRDHVPEIRKLYRNVAQRYTRNPVVVIHGILGARLEDRATKKTVWGAFTSNATDPTTEEGARALALPFADVAAMAMPDLSIAKVFATGPLEAVRLSFLFAVINVGVYADILKTLGVGGYTDSVVLDPASPAYAEDHFTCFTFFYDWRRDCVANAVAFGDYLDEVRKRVDRGARRRIDKLRKDGSPGALAEAIETEHWLADGYRFDVVAHSMGGLLARYYLRYGANPLPQDGSKPAVTWKGADNIDRLVLVGTPSLGSMDAFQNMLCGFSPGGFVLPKFDAAILGTMPAIYQLLPRGEDLVVDENFEPLDVDLFDVQTWDDNQWGLLSPESDQYLRWFLPDVADAAERRRQARTVVASNLERARRFHRSLDDPAAGCPAEVRLFAADSERTLARVQLLADGDRLTANFDPDELWAPGDATVTRRCALADLRSSVDGPTWLRSSVDWTSVTFLPDDHIGLTKNPIFADNLLFYLLEQQPKPR
ncbi:MAG: pimeloyl-ACP methyl ester carboxylesterase [Planctomycetota bacterium]|jgi:pimeloyl-ACP methyl ester carboxylesterase